VNTGVISFVFWSVVVGLPLVLGHPLEPLHPFQKDSAECFFADSAENLVDRGFQLVPRVTLVVSEFPRDLSKEEEVTRGKVGTISRMGYPLGFGGFKTLS
jgi:hypothetical protein